MFESLLIDVALRPISDAVGTLGSVVVNRVAESITHTSLTGGTNDRV